MTQDQIIKGMQRVKFTQASQERHKAAFDEAHTHMVHADTKRVMNWTGIQPPFRPRNAGQVFNKSNSVTA